MKFLTIVAATVILVSNSGYGICHGDLAPASRAETLTQITFENQVYGLCPVHFDSRPAVPSPYTTDDGHAIVLTSTHDSQYMLVPVTLENTKRKGQQRYVNAGDFPTLAQTGYHCERELDQTRMITGRTIAEITELGRPDRLSTSGFLAEGEDIIAVLKGDNRFARRLEISHAQLARPLFHVLNLVARNQEQGNHLHYEGHRAEYPPFYYNGKKISVKVEYTRGGQESIFADGLNGALAIQIRRDLKPREKDYLDSRYAHLSRTQREDLACKLSTLFVGEMLMYYVKWYGFYEGHTEWRADPIAIAFIFGLKDLEQLDAVFDGRLHEALTKPFTRESGLQLDAYAPHSAQGSIPLTPVPVVESSRSLSENSIWLRAALFPPACPDVHRDPYRR